MVFAQVLAACKLLGRKLHTALLERGASIGAVSPNGRLSAVRAAPKLVMRQARITQ